MPESYAAYAPRPPRSTREPGGFAPPTYATHPVSSHPPAPNTQQPPPPVPNASANGFQPFDPAAAYAYPTASAAPAPPPAPDQSTVPAAYAPRGSAGFGAPAKPLHPPPPHMHTDFTQLPPAPQQQPPPVSQAQSFQSFNPGFAPAPAYNPAAPQPQPPASAQMTANAAAAAAMPAMMAGLQQMTAAAMGAGAANGPPAPGAAPPGFNPALGAQLLHTLAPGAAGYTAQMLGEGQERVRSFMRLPKYYFAVDHRYVLRKLSLILMPFVNRTWSRQRGMDPTNYGGSPSADGTSYLPPRDDVNAPDLYIPVMAFMTYVMVVGFVFGVRNAFKADVLANSFSKGLILLSMEVLIIKLGLYLINARPTPWLDVIAYRGYKFVGIVLTIMLGLAMPKVHTPVLLYSATAMGIFLMRSHRRIILPRDVDMQHAQDLARRNAFLLFLSVLQYPIYWFLASVVNVK